VCHIVPLAPGFLWSLSNLFINSLFKDVRTQFIQCKMIELWVKSDLKMILMEIWLNLRFCRGIYLERLRKTTVELRSSLPGPPVYEKGFHSFIHQRIYSSLLGPGLFFSSVIFFTQTVGLLERGIIPVARPLPTHRTTQTQNERTHRHACLEWDSNLRSERPSEQRQFMP
jgi:hypothetical protein